MSFIEELKRRRVIKVAIAYAVVAWAVIEITSTVFPILHLPDWTMRLVVILSLIGLPITLVLAWAFDLTPAGVVMTGDAEDDDSTPQPSGQMLNYVMAVALFAALGFITYQNFFHDPDPASTGLEPSQTSIAVLPFVPLSSGEDDGYFADGLTEEILNSLTQLPELQVIARTSSFFFKGQNLPVPDIAERLNVSHIVEGSVRRDGERVRITAQLIRASDGFHLWSDSYNRTLEDIFAVQVDIAESIAVALDVVLDDSAREIMRRAGTRDVDAFIAYQKGVDAFTMAHAQGPNITGPLVIANKYFEQALKAAPGLTQARLMKADRASHIIIEVAAGLRAEEYAGEASATLKLLREDLDLAWQLSPPGNQRDILNLERTQFSDSWSGLPALIEKAMHPGGCSQINRTTELIAPFGWAEQLASKIRESLECNPMDIGASFNLPWSLIWAGDPESALEAVAAAEDKGLSHPWLADGRYWALLAAGRVDDPALQGPGSIGSNMLFNRQILLEALAGDPAVARQLADEYRKSPYVNDLSSLWVAAVLGDRERANEIAARIDTNPGSTFMISMIVSGCFCGAPFDLDATPNYKARIEEAGFAWPPKKQINYPTKTW